MNGAGSLASRLLVAAALWSAVVLVLAGIALASIYKSQVERGFDSRLNVYLKSLIADLATHADVERAEFGLGEPRFELPLSGWYWQIGRLGTGQTKASRSLFDRNLPFLFELDSDKDEGATREAYVDGPDQQQLRQLERVIDISGVRFVVAVAAEAAEIDEATEEFNAALLVSFFLLGIGLVGTAAVQIAFGLRPITRISNEIAAIRSGSATRIEGAVPREIKPLALEINALLESNRAIVDRARTHVSNLAHALKTPLSVMANEAAAADGPLAGRIQEQVKVMRTQVDHHLERARIAAGIAVVGDAVDAAAVVEAMLRTMGKVHRDRDLVFERRFDQVRFRGERQDLDEMIGNLIDNACKWAASTVSVEVLGEGAAAGERSWLRVLVDDDGPGLSPEQRVEVMQRGRRLDETKPGSGFGLAIASELAVLYGGGLALGPAPRGGLRAELRLPAT